MPKHCYLRENERQQEAVWKLHANNHAPSILGTTRVFQKSCCNSTLNFSLTCSSQNSQSNRHYSSALSSQMIEDDEIHEVEKVIDGDTLIVSNIGKVRLLGIDCPEPNEELYQEAKDFVVTKCLNKEIRLSYDDKTDKYGRRLASVDVVEENRLSKEYINLEEALVSAGLANVYFPSTGSTSYNKRNKDKLIALQSKARKEGQGIWKNFVDSDVYASENSYAFHRRNCMYQKNKTNFKKFLTSECLDKGISPCRECCPLMS